jgi:hypothetical protein
MKRTTVLIVVGILVALLTGLGVQVAWRVCHPRAIANFGQIRRLPKFRGLNCAKSENLVCRCPASTIAITQLGKQVNLSWEMYRSSHFPTIYPKYAIALPLPISQRERGLAKILADDGCSGM